MTEEKYWNLLEIAWMPVRNASPYEVLKMRLKNESLSELISFLDHFNSFRKGAATAIQLAAAFVLYEGVFDNEDFLEYLEALVAVPKNVFTDSEQNPDKIFDHIEYTDLIERDGHPFATVATSIGEEKFGGDWRQELMNHLMASHEKNIISLDKISYGGKCGYEIITRDFCKKNIPRIFAKYGSCCKW